MNTELTPIIDTILRTIAVDEIYQWTYAHDGKKYQILQINILSSAGIRGGDPLGLVNKIIKNYPSVYAKVNFTQEVQKKLNQGLGRTYLIYQSQNRVYRNPAQEIPLVFPEYTAAEIIEKTRSYIDKEKSKIRSFIDGYNFYQQHKSHAHAAFMLHQAIEL